MEEFGDDPKVEFAAVDFTQETGVCGASDVRGYPTHRYYNYFKTSRHHNSGRTKSDFIQFLRDPSDPLSSARLRRPRRRSGVTFRAPSTSGTSPTPSSIGRPRGAIPCWSCSRRPGVATVSG